MSKTAAREAKSPSSAAPNVVSKEILGSPGRPGANDRINHAVIGLGGMGQGHLGYVLNDPQAKLVAVCDVMQSRVKAAVEPAGVDYVFVDTTKK